MPARKRAAAEVIHTPETGGGSRRRSNRISLSNKKSIYFDDDDNDPDDKPPPRKATKTQARGRPAGQKKTKKAESDDELIHEDDAESSDDKDDDDGFAEDEPESEDDSESEEAPPVVRKRGRGRPSKTKAETSKVMKKSNANARIKAKAKKTAEPKKPELEEDSEEYDNNEDRITFIPAIPLRDTGGVEYEDTRLHKNTFLFLRDLKANNNREWLKKYNDEYRRSLKDWESFVETLTEKIIEADETIPELPVKDVIFRIYRDIRFSKDQTPYKPHYSAAWSRTGRKGPYACYYVHVEPGHCMVGGGLWHPDKDSIALLRASIDERPHRIKRVLMNPKFCKTFLPGAKPNSEKSVVAAFAAVNQENALKTKPKGFHPEHQYIELLKLRNYTVGTQIDDSVFLADDAQDQVMDVISAMVEFITFLNSVVKPDPNQASDSDGEDGEEAHEDEDGDTDS